MTIFYILKKIAGYQRNIIIILIAILYASTNLQAQVFRVSQVDATEFPVLHTTFDARDAMNQKYFGITPDDFEIIDNKDTIASKNIFVDCDPNLPISLVLIMDFSTSIIDNHLGSWSKVGIQEFFSAYPLKDGSEAALIQFSDTARLLVDFTTDAATLAYYSGTSTTSGGNTNYNDAFRLAVKILAERPIPNPKYIIMMSDGAHRKPGVDLDLGGIVKSLVSNTITLFGITLQNNSLNLSEIAGDAKGYGYYASDISKMQDIMNTIANILKTSTMCRLSWLNIQKPCEYIAGDHKASIKFLRNGLKVDRNYVAPADNVYAPKIKFRDKSFYAGSYTAKTLHSITMHGELINYDSFPIDLNELALTKNEEEDYHLIGNYENITILPGDSIDIKIEFTPEEYGMRECELVADIDCMEPLKLVLRGIGLCDVDAVPLKYFGSVKIYDKKIDTIVCAIQNLTAKDIAVTPRIEGPARADYTMRILGLPDGAYNNVSLPGYSCFDIEITFIPSEFGQRDAFINYYLPNNCNTNVTELRGNGTVPNLGITSYDWGKRRVKGMYNGSISVYNNTPLSYKLIDLGFVYQNQSIFGLAKPDLPVDIPANGSIDIQVEFNPAMERDYHEQIKAIVENKPDALISDLTGSGFLPKLEIQSLCGEPVKIGDTSHAMVTLTNPSLSSVLTIDKIVLNDPDNEFSIEGNPVLSNLVVNTNSSETFGISFIPGTLGDHSCVIDIYADNYDATFTDQWKVNSLNMSCPILDLEFTNPLYFGPILPCGKSMRPAIIKNLSSIQTLSVYLSQAYFNHNGDFSLNSVKDLEILPLSQDSIFVAFNPQQPGKTTNVLNIPNSFNIPININLTGESIEIIPSAENISYTVSVGQEFKFPIKAALGKTNPIYISNMSIYLNYNRKAIAVKPETFKEVLTNSLADDERWTWEKPIFGVDNIFLEGSGKLNTPFDKTLYNIDFVALLTEFVKTDINAKIDYGCYQSERKISEVNINPVCIQGSRYVQISDVLFGLNKISPSPANSVAEIEFGIGFDSQTCIELYNTLGKLEYTLVSGNLETGLYTIDLDCTQLSNGIYYIKFNAGGYSETKPLVIRK